MKTIGHSSKFGRAELDSHADTCCAGATSAMIEYTGKTCDISPFSKEYDANEVSSTIQCMYNNKALGLSGVTTDILKQLPEEELQLLTHMIQ